MKRILFIIVVAGCTADLYAQAPVTAKKQDKMKLNAGIITNKLAESKAFYTETLGFGVRFENEFYLLLHTANQQFELSFLLPNHPTQQPLFHASYKGEGLYLTIEVEDVDRLYREIKKKAVPVKIDIRNEPWGDRHFAIQDPNGVAIDIVQYAPPAAN